MWVGGKKGGREEEGRGNDRLLKGLGFRV